MGSVALSGSDVTIIDDEIITDFADGACVQLAFDTPIGVMKISKDGNAIYAMKYEGIVVKVTLRLIRGSYDDQILNAKLQQFLASPDMFTLMAGSFVKRVGDGQGNITSEVYQLAGGIFEYIPGAKMNTSGDTEQSVTEYKMLFRNNIRMMQ